MRHDTPFVPGLALLALILSLPAPDATALPAYGQEVDSYCTAHARTPAAPYAGDCTICHSPSGPGANRTEGFDRYRARDLDFFCPATLANRPPVLDPIGNRSVSEDGLLAIRITSTDPDGDGVWLEAASLPTGAGFADNGDGTGDFVWMPGFDQAGNYTVIFKATDDASPPASASETITITVGNTNRPPVLDPVGNRMVEVGALLAFTLAAHDPDGDGLRFGSAGLPAGAALTDLGNGSAEFSWVPAAADAGDHPVTFTVTDTGVPAASDAEQIVLTAHAAGGENHPPVLAPIGGQTVQEGALLDLAVTATDPDGDPLQLTATDLPVGASFADLGDGSALLSWMPGFDQAGNHVVSCTVSDGAASDSESFTITVGAVNRPPVLDPVGLVREGDRIASLLTARDPDGDALSFGGQGLPAGAELVDHGDGTADFGWQPPADLATAPVVVFTVTDHGTPPESDSQEVTLDAPVPQPGGALRIDRARWKRHRGRLSVKGRGAMPGATVDLLDATSGQRLSSGVARDSGRFGIRAVLDPTSQVCEVRVEAGGVASEPVRVRHAARACGDASAGGGRSEDEEDAVRSRGQDSGDEEHASLRSDAGEDDERD